MVATREEIGQVVVDVRSVRITAEVGEPNRIDDMSVDRPAPGRLVVGEGCVEHRPHVLVGVVGSPDTDDRHVEEPGRGQLVDRREELLVAEVAGEAEHHQRVGSDWSIGHTP